MPILEWEIWPIGSHQPIYRHIFTHYPKKWLWFPFEPINLYTGIFTDTHSWMGNWTNWVPSTYLLVYFHALSHKVVLSPFRAHQPINRYIHGFPFRKGTINVFTVTFLRIILKNNKFARYISIPMTPKLEDLFWNHSHPIYGSNFAMYADFFLALVIHSLGGCSPPK